MNLFRKKAPATRLLSRITSEDVVSSFGNVLATEKPGFGCSYNEDKLPFDKALIKAAILDVSSRDGTSKAQIDALGVAFLSLGDFIINGDNPSTYGISPEKLRTKLNEPGGIDAFIEPLSREADAIEASGERMPALLAEWNAHCASLKANKNA